MGTLLLPLFDCQRPTKNPGLSGPGLVLTLVWKPRSAASPGRSWILRLLFGANANAVDRGVHLALFLIRSFQHFLHPFGFNPRLQANSTPTSYNAGGVESRAIQDFSCYLFFWLRQGSCPYDLLGVLRTPLEKSHLSALSAMLSMNSSSLCTRHLGPGVGA